MPPFRADAVRGKDPFTMANVSILLAVRALVYQGRDILGENWDALWSDLGEGLRGKGLEAAAGSEDLLLVRFPQLRSALAALFDALALVKKEGGWQESLGPVPVQIVFHLEKEDELPGPMHDASANFWDLLQPEKIYVTRALKLQWGPLAAESSLPPHDFAEAEQGLFLLSLAEEPLPARPQISLFPHRALALAGDLPSCFYCGMKSHKPALCPSKMLTMATQGVLQAGYLPLDTLAGLFVKAMNGQEKLNPILAAGLTSSQIRQNPLLQVYLSFFDLNLVFQLRFLRSIAFSAYSNWDDLRKPEIFATDNQGLHMAFDCLRVNQYAQAEELFVEESRRPKGRPFYAAIGRAFIALELERDSDMGHFLESALTLASSEKEKIYVLLLQSRYHWLHNDHWKAEHSLDQVFTLRRDLEDALYLQIQFMAQQNMGEKGLRRLQSLVAERRESFLTVLLDPQLLAIAGLVEEILAAQHLSKRQEAEESLEKARAVCTDLQTWFDTEEAPPFSFAEDLAGLEKQCARGSYYDHLDVVHKTRMLLPACYRLQESKLDEMKEQLGRLRVTWEAYRLFWRNYPYQSFFREFGEGLEGNGKKLAEIEKKSEQNMYGALYRSIQETMAQVRAGFDLLKELSVRMGWVKVFFDGVKLFGRRLLLTEIVLLSMGLALVPILAFWLTGTEAAGIITLFQEPRVQKQVLLVITLLIAPILALGQTLWRLMD